MLPLDAFFVGSQAFAESAHFARDSSFLPCLQADFSLYLSSRTHENPSCPAAINVFESEPLVVCTNHVGGVGHSITSSFIDNFGTKRWFTPKNRRNDCLNT